MPYEHYEENHWEGRNQAFLGHVLKKDVYKPLSLLSRVILVMIAAAAQMCDVNADLSLADASASVCAFAGAEAAANLDLKKRRKKMQWCSNCGRYGHSPKICQYPVMSCGMILFDRKPVSDDISNDYLRRIEVMTGGQFDLASAELDQHDVDYFQLSNAVVGEKRDIRTKTHDIKYLLVRRKDSLNYVEFIRGKYNREDVKFLYQAFSEISVREREQIRIKPFNELWKGLWMSVNSAGYLTTSEYVEAEKRFQKLKDGYWTLSGQHISLNSLLMKTSSKYECPEWGFPKGKRNKRETDFECARREFFEETRIREEEYTVINRLNSVSETFKGSNNIFYKHVYFVGRCLNERPVSLNAADAEQLAEIGDIGWFTADEALQMFRPYDVEKKALLMRLDNVLSHIEFSEEYHSSDVV